MDMWHVHQTLFLLLLLPIIIFTPFTIGTKLQRIFWTYLLASSIWTAFYPFVDITYLDKALAFQLPGSAAQAALITLLLPIAIFRANNSWLKTLFKAVAVIESIALLGFDHTLFYGTTFSSAYCLICLPLIDIKKSKWDWLMVLPLFTFMVYGGSTALAIALIYCAFTYRIADKPLCVILFSLGIYILTRLHPQVLEFNGRLEMWREYYWQFFNHMPLMQGTGIGTWEWIGPFLFKASDGSRFLWVHNDFLQMLFEGGLIGFALMFVVIVEVLWLVRTRPKLLMMSLAFLVFMFTYYPMHWTVTQCLALYIVKRSNDFPHQE